MFVATLAHYCPCGGEFLPEEISVTEDKDIRFFGECATCGKKVSADTPITEFYKLALRLKAESFRHNHPRLLPPPSMETEDTNWLHEMGIGGEYAV